jgi:hypothetical protein
MHLPVVGEHANIGVLGDEIDAEAVCRHYGRRRSRWSVATLGRILPTALGFGDELRVAFVLVCQYEHVLVIRFAKLGVEAAGHSNGGSSTEARVVWGSRRR